MDAQECFDKVVVHLIKQGKTCYDPIRNISLYRTKDGLKGAIGCLIEDDEYDPSFESLKLAQLLEVAPDSLKERLAPHFDLLIDLQKAHNEAINMDNARYPSNFIYKEWDICFKEIAYKYHLSYDFVDESRKTLT